jgi:hypothetical protein
VEGSLWWKFSSRSREQPDPGGDEQDTRRHIRGTRSRRASLAAWNAFAELFEKKIAK